MTKANCGMTLHAVAFKHFFACHAELRPILLQALLNRRIIT
jgi:hypothetical protein